MRVCVSCFLEFTKILVIGGQKVGDIPVNTIELIDLSDKLQTCSIVPNYPLNAEFITTTYYKGKIVACGGGDPPNTDKCFELASDLTEWVEVASIPSGNRAVMASSIIDNKWLISGGWNGGIIFESTFFYDGKDIFDGPVMPSYKFGHCQITLNSTHVFLASGGEENAKTFLLNWTTQKYSVLDSVPINRPAVTCGLLNNPTYGPEILVADGLYGSFFSLTTFTWRDGPKVPGETLYATSATAPNGFLVIGGMYFNSTTFEYYDSVYKFDEYSYEWSLEKQHLQEPRRAPAAVAVPDSFLQCQ